MSADESIAALKLMSLSGIEAAAAAALAMGEVVEREMRAQLSKTSHAPGTPTPSEPGEPPSMVSGDLRDSVIVKEVAPGYVQVGATTLYARIQQLGGMSGRGRATQTPARPYLEPTLENSALQARQAAIEVLVEGIFRG